MKEEVDGYRDAQCNIPTTSHRATSIKVVVLNSFGLKYCVFLQKVSLTANLWHFPRKLGLKY